MRPTVLVLVVLSVLFGSGCMRVGRYGRPYGMSRYGSGYQVVGPGVSSSTTTVTTTGYASPYAVGPTTYSTYGYGGAYGTGSYGTGSYGTGSYGTGSYGPILYGTSTYGTSSSGPTGYSGYDTSAYGYGVTSAYGAPAGYGATSGAPSTYGTPGVTVTVTPR